MAKYGIPYMGSKGPLADWLIDRLPDGANFYDLFGGGFAVTHAALLSGKWQNFYFNEIQPGICELVQAAIRGDFSYSSFRPPWISRDEFHANKFSDAYTRCIWSFGNNQKNYLFGRDIEGKKRAGHMAVVFEQIDSFASDVLGFKNWDAVGLSGPGKIKERRLFWRRTCFNTKTRGLQQLQQLERLERLEQLQQLQRLQRLEQLERLQFSTSDYRSVLIKPNSIIYCDPPYRGTGKYHSGDFDHEAFDDWAMKCEHPVFVSEYSMPDGFTEIASRKKQQKFRATKTRKVFTEKIFANPAAIEALGSTSIYR